MQNQFRPGIRDPDQALSLRTLVTLGARVGPITVLGELQDSRAYLTTEDSGISTIVVDALEPLQAYVSLDLKGAISKGDMLTLRGGRQTIDLGGRRLLARNRFRNTIQNYTGLTASWLAKSGARLFLLGVLPVRAKPSNEEPKSLANNRIELDRESSDLFLWGAFFEHPIGPNVSLEAYFFGLYESDGPRYPSRNRQLYTPGMRLVRNPSGDKWDVDLENILQMGKRRATLNPNDTESLPVVAHFHHASVGYTFGYTWLPRISAELDYASGDDPLTAKRYERFDSLFGPRRTEFGPTGIYGLLGRENIVSTGLRLGARPHARLDAYVSWRANWLADKRDVFARSGVRDERGQSGTFAGNQVEVRSQL